MFNEKNVDYDIHENIAKNIIFVDGLTRSGKTSLNNILPSLENFEHTRVFTILDLIVPGLSFGSMDEEYAKAYIRISFNEMAYNNLISRNTNFRYDDATGIFNYKEPSVYFKRLGKEEGEIVVEELRNGKHFIPIRTHEQLVNLEYLNKLDIDYKMLAIFRNPIDVSHSWWVRGLGSRYGKDPRAFTITIKYNDEGIPWYCRGVEQEWLHLNSYERCVMIVMNLIKRAVQQYKKTLEKDRIHIFTYEDFVQRTEEELKRICDFIGTGTTVYTPQALLKARCPRALDADDRKRKLAEFEANVKKDLLDKLLTLSESYERHLYGLR